MIKLNRNTFKKGIAIIASTFPEKEIQAEIAYECLKDLTDEQFMKSIMVILKTEIEIKKSTNIMALIRARVPRGESNITKITYANTAEREKVAKMIHDTVKKMGKEICKK